MLSRLRAWFEDFGSMILFAGEALAWTLRPPFRPELLVFQMAAIGVGSAFIIVTTGFFTGVIFCLQMNYAMATLGAQGYVGGSTAIALVRELGPVFTSLFVVARSGSAISTELGTMRVTEQIDAMETMAVDPVQYLVVPRVLACVLMFPVLTMVFNAVGYAGAYLMGIFVADIPAGPFIEHTRSLLVPADVVHGLLKATLFGYVVSVISCWRGYAAAGGSRGVGEGTTRAVVMSSVAILLVDSGFVLLTVGGGR